MGSKRILDSCFFLSLFIYIKLHVSEVCSLGFNSVVVFLFRLSMETEQPQTCYQSLLQGRKFFVLALPLILVAFGLLFLPVMFFYIPVEVIIM